MSEQSENLFTLGDFHVVESKPNEDGWRIVANFSLDMPAMRILHMRLFVDPRGYFAIRPPRATDNKGRPIFAIRGFAMPLLKLAVGAYRAMGGSHGNAHALAERVEPVQDSAA